MEEIAGEIKPSHAYLVGILITCLIFTLIAIVDRAPFFTWLIVCLGITLFQIGFVLIILLIGGYIAYNPQHLVGLDVPSLNDILGFLGVVAVSILVFLLTFVVGYGTLTLGKLVWNLKSYEQRSMNGK